MTFKIKNKLLIYLFLFFTIIMPITVKAYSKKVILGGQNVGIEIKSKGVLVVGFYDVDGISPGKDAGLKIGDVILSINDKEISSINDFTLDTLESYKVTYKRNDAISTLDLNLVKDSDGVYKTGLFVKDSIVGIGTLTFIDGNTNMFGALGHSITESTTGYKFDVEDGSIFKSYITGLNKSTRNNPGEKIANYDYNLKYGSITKNLNSGIYGYYNADIDTSNLIEIAEIDEIKLGDAYIYTVIDGDTVEKFKINIINVSNSSNGKDILFEVVDERLLSLTNGIIQGMSGSPIVQNNKLVGAVNYVVIDNPHKGYGILIGNMLKEIE